VPAGSYSIFIIPSRDRWTWIVNKNAAANTDQHKESEDVVRVAASVERIPARERLTFLFADTTDDSTRLDLEWATSRSSLPIRAFTEAQVKQAIAQVENGAWRPLDSAARYLLETKKDPETAMR